MRDGAGSYCGDESRNMRSEGKSAVDDDTQTLDLSGWCRFGASKNSQLYCH